MRDVLCVFRVPCSVFRVPCISTIHLSFDDARYQTPNLHVLEVHVEGIDAEDEIGISLTFILQ